MTATQQNIYFASMQQSAPCHCDNVSYGILESIKTTSNITQEHWTLFDCFANSVKGNRTVGINSTMKSTLKCFISILKGSDGGSQGMGTHPPGKMGRWNQLGRASWVGIFLFVTTSQDCTKRWWPWHGGRPSSNSGLSVAGDDNDEHNKYL